MKKIISLVSLITMLTITSYADTIITAPAVGIDFTVASNTVFAPGFNMGINVGYLGTNGFTFLFNTGCAMGILYGNIPIQTIFGYTFRSQDERFHFMIGAGLGTSIPFLSVDIPIHLSFDCYFTNYFALNFTINNALGFMFVHEFGIKNSIQLTIGPKVKI